MNEFYYELNNNIDYYAILPFIVPLAAGLISAISFYILSEGIKRLIKIGYDIKGLAIVGTTASGKTTIWNFLRKKEDIVPTSTTLQDIESFTTKINGKLYRIKKSKDIGGDDNFVDQYEKALSQNEKGTILERYIGAQYFVLFTFNAKLVYENNLNEIRDIRRRFYPIKHHLNQQKDKRQFHLIGSHLDKIKNNSDLEAIKHKIKENIGDKYFNVLPEFNLDKNFILLNLTNDKEITEYINQIFKLKK